MNMKPSMSISIFVVVAFVATSARAFVQAPTRYAVSSSERHTRSPPRYACQPHRQRTLISTMFAAEEPAAATAAEEPTATADGAAAGGEVAANTGPAIATNDGSGPVEQELTYEQLTRKAKLEEIERLRSKEKFITQKTGDYECTQCSFVYSPFKDGQGALSGTQFEELPSTWLCPVCKSPKNTFVAQTKTIAGFEDNQQYGLGANSMTAGQKNLLIFGSLAAFFLLFLGGYLLE